MLDHLVGLLLRALNAQVTGAKPLQVHDDIKLDYSTLEVKFTGPVDEEMQGRMHRSKARSDLYFELMAYYGETKNPVPTQDAPFFGPYSLFYVIQLTTLPPRIRDLCDEVFEAIRKRSYKGRYIGNYILDVPNN